MSWQLLTAISALSLSVSVLLQRILLHKDKTDPYAYAVVFQGIVGALLLVFTAFHGLTLAGFGEMWLPATIAMLCFGLGHIVYAKALQRVEASVFSVLFATQAIWIMLLGIAFFAEQLTAWQAVGSALIFGAVALLVKSIRHFTLDRGTILGLTTGLLFGIAITAWSYVGRHMDTLSWAALSFVGTAAVSLAARPRTIRDIPALLQGAILRKLSMLSIFYALGSVTMLFAYKIGTFTIVSPLRQTSIIMTVLLALLFLPAERTGIGRKVAAALICFGGVLLIVAT